MFQAWTFHLLLNEMAGRGTAPALIAIRNGTLEALSFAELQCRIFAAANKLQQFGVRADHPVALMGSNGFEWVIARLALGAIGAAVLTLDELASDAERRAVLTQCKPTHIVECSPKTLRKHFRRELDRGAAEANAAIAGYLFQNAKAGNMAAQIFWLKTARAGRQRWHQ